MRREVDEKRKCGQVRRGNCKRLIFNYNLPARAGGAKPLDVPSDGISLWKQNIIPQLLQWFASATFFELWAPDLITLLIIALKRGRPLESAGIPLAVRAVEAD